MLDWVMAVNRRLLIACYIVFYDSAVKFANNQPNTFLLRINELLDCWYRLQNPQAKSLSAFRVTKFTRCVLCYDISLSFSRIQSKSIRNPSSTQFFFMLIISSNDHFRTISSNSLQKVRLATIESQDRTQYPGHLAKVLRKTFRYELYADVPHDWILSNKSLD